MTETMKPKINPNVLSLKESATLAINLKARAAIKEGKQVCHFGFGQSPFSVHPLIQEELANNSHQKDYLPTRGLPELCQTISEFHKRVFNYDLYPEGILIGPGSKEMIFQALFALEGKVLVPAPSWVSYGPQVNIKGDRIIEIQTSKDNSYKLQGSELEAICKSEGNGQKILILNNPTNPTGAIYSEKEIKEISEVSKANNVIVISDEIYSLVNFEGEKYHSCHEYYPEGTIITSGLSKSHAAGGYRMGFISFPQNMCEVIKAISALVSETFSAVSAPIQYASVIAYSDNEELLEYIRQCTKIHKACGEYLAKRFQKMGLACPMPGGAFYLFPDFNDYKDKLEAKGIGTATKLANALFDQKLVAILPGSDFYLPESYLGCRVATVDYDGESVYQASLKVTELGDSFVEQNCPNLKEGADRIESFLDAL